MIVRDLNKKEATYSINPHATIGQFKQQIAESLPLGVSATDIRLAHIGRMLSDQYTLHQEQLSDGSCVVLTFGLRGGGDSEFELPAGPLHLTIKDAKGRRRMLIVEPNATPTEVKAQLPPARSSALLFRGKPLNAALPLRQQGVQYGSTLFYSSLR